MNQNPSIRFVRCLSIIGGLGLTLSSAQTTVFEENFDALNGRAPDIRPGTETWVASPQFRTSGAIKEGSAGSSATLAFLPVDGFIYTLDASFRNLGGTANAGSPENDWVAVGFAKGQAAGTSSNNRFINNNVIGKAWMLLRGADTVGTLDNVAQLGSATVGNSSSASWSDPTLVTTFGGDMDMRVVLDTTWSAKLPADEAFTEVRSTTVLVDEDIDSVGVAISNSGIAGDLTFISLTSLAGAVEQTIYQHTLDESAPVDINGLSPDVTTDGATWTASPVFNDDGSVDRPEGTSTVGNRGSMTLPFTPLNGFIYTLDASLSGVTGDTDWFGLGFAKGQSLSSTIDDRFVSGGTVVGSTWMLFRGANPDPVATNGNKIQLGLGNASSSNWLTLAAQNGGDIDMRIVLDTTGGTDAWTATWYAKLPTFGSYSLVRNTTPIPHDSSNYTSVGIAASNTSSTDGTGGTINRFSLTAFEANTSLPNITGIEIDGGGDVILTLDGPTDGLTVQQSNELTGFSDISATASGNTLTIAAADVDPNADGKDFYRVRN